MTRLIRSVCCWFCCVAFGGFFVTSQAWADYASQVLSLNPNQYWRLGETSGPTAFNEVGGGVLGTYNNNTLGLAGPRPPAFPGFDAANNAPLFNGVDSVVTTGSALLDNQTAFTMLGWFYQAANQPNIRTGLFGQDNAIEFGFVTSDTLQLWTFSSHPGLDVPWDGSLNNSWVFVAAVGDGTNTYIYINGALAGSLVSPTGNYGLSATSFNIGGNVFGPLPTEGNFDGEIDEVAIFNNRALTAAEIGSLYDEAIGPTAPSAVPEPSTLMLAGMGVAASLLWHRRRSRRRAP